MSLDANGDGSLTIDELKKGLEGKENGEMRLQVLFLPQGVHIYTIHILYCK